MRSLSSATDALYTRCEPNFVSSQFLRSASITIFSLFFSLLAFLGLYFLALLSFLCFAFLSFFSFFFSFLFFPSFSFLAFFLN